MQNFTNSKSVSDNCLKPIIDTHFLAYMNIKTYYIAKFSPLLYGLVLAFKYKCRFEKKNELLNGRLCISWAHFFEKRHSLQCFIDTFLIQVHMNNLFYWFQIHFWHRVRHLWFIIKIRTSINTQVGNEKTDQFAHIG